MHLCGVVAPIEWIGHEEHLPLMVVEKRVEVERGAAYTLRGKLAFSLVYKLLSRPIRLRRVSDIDRELFILKGVAIKLKEFEQELTSRDRVAVFVTSLLFHGLVEPRVVNELVELIRLHEARVRHANVVTILLLQLVSSELLVLRCLCELL